MSVSVCLICINADAAVVVVVVLSENEVRNRICEIFETISKLSPFVSKRNVIEFQNVRPTSVKVESD